MRKPIVGITVGDFNGVGPEVVLKAVRHSSVRAACVPLLIGPPVAFEYYARILGYRFQAEPVTPLTVGTRRPARGATEVLCSSEIIRGSIRPGKVSSLAGRAAARAIEEGVRLALSGTIAALVTAPVSKRALHAAGYEYPGQTEFLRALSRSRHVCMMLVCARLRVGLATTHCALKDVPGLLSRNLLKEQIAVLHDALRRDWRVRSPRIAVLALNPHAGESGDLGTEERRILIPAVRMLRDRGVDCQGPFPADGFFARYRAAEWDAVMAMYHDQGLVPLKLLARGSAVNVTAGLPIIRTSPGHGTAMDIAGKGCARDTAMVSAILTAAMIARKRAAHDSGRRQ